MCIQLDSVPLATAAGAALALGATAVGLQGRLALQTKLAAPQVLDLIRANSLTRNIKDGAEHLVVYKALPKQRGLRQVLFVDAGKGDYKKADKYPMLAFMILLQPDLPNTFDGPVQAVDWRLKRSPRVGKSSLHVEALAAVNGVERAETVAGCLEEFYNRPPHVETFLELQEAGGYGVPTDLLTDSKSLYDLLTGIGEPRPSDEGSLLYLLWLRERIKRGSIRLPLEIEYAQLRIFSARAQSCRRRRVMRASEVSCTQRGRRDAGAGTAAAR